LNFKAISEDLIFDVCDFFRCMSGFRLVEGSGKVKVKVALEQATKAQEGVGLYLYSFFNLGAGRR
jgi:hypothetical protein